MFVSPKIAFFGVASVLSAAHVLSAVAQEARTVSNPSTYILEPITKSRAKLETFAQNRAPFPGEVLLDMSVTYLDRQIYNPATVRYDRVRLRGYQDARRTGPSGADTPLVGPTIDVRPGETVRVTLNNMLPQDSTCGIGGGSANTRHCFNGTNLHSHGLWVNPSGNCDNVLVSIRPGVEFQYEYNIPADHPASTFWYHPHLHGSTALQVSSGMSGALIIRGDRMPTPTEIGDLDRLLKQPDGSDIPERVLVLQQIQDACTDSDGGITYDCKPGQVGGIESYDQFGPGSWPASGRFTSINGQVLSQLAPALAGSIERWRMIHAGVRDTINFEIRRKTGTAALRTLTAADTDRWIDQNCGKDTIPYGVVAQDGLTMAQVQMRQQAVLQPGYRVDALVVLPQAGDYCLVDAAAPAAASVNQIAPSHRLLGIVTAVEGNAVNGEIGTTYLQDWLISAAERTMAPDVAGEVVEDLKNDMRLSNFVPHPDIEPGEQQVVFKIDVKQPGGTFFELDGQPYDANRIDRTLPLNGVDEWALRSDFVSHPFHIHVNPFQIIKIIDAAGNDVRALGADDDGDPQYPGLKNVWKATLWFKNPGTDPSTSYTNTVQTRYQRYIGEFVLHCHILDHEDQGMMQNVRITLPDGHGGTVTGHH
ncbi:multicopper oxidase domain-containing protein [Sinorhizobium medicae]|uniref:Multicopper oxidase type 3 n=2 Tax=Sinorhizobium medicae TaxID=110321 RepID=A6UM84_SINMW|nr:multicopper oxidase domain-containing protein [Sinorhizobium medicae]ABR64764.1 multicopper oxidase type 3 [Sinorhizobium medicae WSM419]MBO1945057.1 multicopper oxidase domain-containing protein [Sinorhizobium medicae]MDX0408904.1 multicopper oxidase domain-containing protein [Sinorhizobium medicae]MDX0414906.1 multicopper oxidase domain-containing protein [Sinorhizobium medicae]MDX0420900.1 multicopper oxidase domain-containing protein [Sinorhizobium medicae]